MATVVLEGELGYETIAMVSERDARALILDDDYLAILVDLPRHTRFVRRSTYGRCRITIEQIAEARADGT